MIKHEDLDQGGVRSIKITPILRQAGSYPDQKSGRNFHFLWERLISEAVAIVALIEPVVLKEETS